MDEAQNAAQEASKGYFRVTDQLPEEVWYWAAVGSIGLSLLLKLLKKNDLALFVGQWPPTFLLFGIFHRLLKPTGN